MNDLFLYAVNFTLVILLAVSAAGSVLFLLLDIFAGLFSDRYEVRCHYSLMRAVLLFYLLPVIVMVAAIVAVQTNVEWGILTPSRGMEAVGFTDHFGIMMLSNHKLNVARVCIFGVWLAGFAAAFFWRLAREWHTLRAIRRRSVEWDAEPVDRLRRKAMQETGCGRKICIYQSGVITTPFSAGILRPAIYFPETVLDEDALYSILKHEYIHCKRGDLICRLFLMLLRGMHWFNPVVFLFARDFFRYSEMACDEEALKGADTDARYRYAELVLSMLDTRRGTACGSAFAGRNEAEMKKRMVHIMRGKRKVARAAAAFSAVFFMALCPAAAYAASQGVAAVAGRISEIAEEETMFREEMKEYEAYTAHVRVGDVNPLRTLNVPSAVEDGIAIDAAIREKEEKRLWGVSLKEGDMVTVNIRSGSAGDAFSVGFMDLDGDADCVDSENGCCAHTFRADRASDYVLFIKGKCAAGGEIHAAGRITEMLGTSGNVLAAHAPVKISCRCCRVGSAVIKVWVNGRHYEDYVIPPDGTAAGEIVHTVHCSVGDTVTYTALPDLAHYVRADGLFTIYY